MITEKARAFIRHPSDIPIAVKSLGSKQQQALALNNISHGGLAFNTPECFETGTVVTIKISSVKPIFKVQGIVAWCDATNTGFDVGVEFVGNGDAYRVRMVEQVCHIEQYKQQIRENEGRRLSGNAAAQEWIEKYASTFPNPSL